MTRLTVGHLLKLCVDRNLDVNQVAIDIYNVEYDGDEIESVSIDHPDDNFAQIKENKIVINLDYPNEIEI